MKISTYKRVNQSDIDNSEFHLETPKANCADHIASYIAGILCASLLIFIIVPHHFHDESYSKLPSVDTPPIDALLVKTSPTSTHITNPQEVLTKELTDALDTSSTKEAENSLEMVHETITTQSITSNSLDAFSKESSQNADMSEAITPTDVTEETCTDEIYCNSNGEAKWFERRAIRGCLCTCRADFAPPQCLNESPGDSQDLSATELIDPSDSSSSNLPTEALESLSTEETPNVSDETHEQVAQEISKNSDLTYVKPNYYLGPLGSVCSSKSEVFRDESQCENALKELNLISFNIEWIDDYPRWQGKDSNSGWRGEANSLPSGCSFRPESKRPHINSNSGWGAGRYDLRPVCSHQDFEWVIATENDMNNCDDLCAALGKSCHPASFNDLTSEESLASAFYSAGKACEKFLDNELELSTAIQWEGPWIAGSTCGWASISPTQDCAKSPADGYMRLCPCGEKNQL